MSNNLLDAIGVKKAFLRTFIAFKRMNKWVVRLPNNRVDPNRVKSDAEQQTNTSFGDSRKFDSKFANAMRDCPAWAAAARHYGKDGQNGDNFQHHVNHDKLAGKVVACFHLFRFSMGTRSLPWNLDATRDGTTVTITWHDPRHSGHASPHDTLLVGLLYSRHPGRPLLIDHTGATRADGSFSFTINPRHAHHQNIHIYPFFANPQRTEFSDSQHVSL